MKLEKMKFNMMLLKKNMTLMLAQFWNNWNKKLLNSLELCSKRLMKLLKVGKANESVGSTIDETKIEDFWACKSCQGERRIYYRDNEG
jgi:hypothetical protein